MDVAALSRVLCEASPGLGVLNASAPSAGAFTRVRQSLDDNISEVAHHSKHDRSTTTSSEVSLPKDDIAKLNPDPRSFFPIDSMVDSDDLQLRRAVAP